MKHGRGPYRLRSRHCPANGSSLQSLNISEHRHSIRNGGMGSDDPAARHTLRDHIGVEHGLEDDNTEVKMVNGTMAPTSGKGRGTFR